MVSQIEKGMPQQAFAVWFQKLVGSKTPITWEMNDCGEQTGTPEDRGKDFSMCVEATAKTSADFYISVNIQYGTFKRGITGGKPVVRYIYCGGEVRQNGVSLDTLKYLRQRAEDLIRDAEFFDPNIGIFALPLRISTLPYPVTMEPPGFENFDAMWIETHEFVVKGKDVVLKPLKKKGVIKFGQTEFALRNIFFDGKRWTFETEQIEDVSYQFAGKFTLIKLDQNGVQNWDNVLQGHLIKFTNGIKTAEADLVLSFYLEGE